MLATIYSLYLISNSKSRDRQLACDYIGSHRRSSRLARRTRDALGRGFCRTARPHGLHAAPQHAAASLAARDLDVPVHPHPAGDGLPDRTPFLALRELHGHSGQHRHRRFHLPLRVPCGHGRPAHLEDLRPGDRGS